MIIILLFPFSVFSQNMEFKFFISFTDKDLSEYSLFEPEKFLSKESLLRREKQGKSWRSKQNHRESMESIGNDWNPLIIR